MKLSGVRLKVNTISYRKGFIEISAGIHENCINIETWDVLPDLDITNLDIRSNDFPEDGVQGNTELELDLSTAEDLVAKLQEAIAVIRKSPVA